LNNEIGDEGEGSSVQQNINTRNVPECSMGMGSISTPLKKF
jgi:hypothetical protein